MGVQERSKSQLELGRNRCRKNVVCAIWQLPLAPHLLWFVLELLGSSVALVTPNMHVTNTGASRVC